MPDHVESSPTALVVTDNKMTSLFCVFSKSLSTDSAPCSQALAATSLATLIRLAGQHTTASVADLFVIHVVAQTFAEAILRRA
jgi:hypothetical protein